MKVSAFLHYPDVDNRKAWRQVSDAVCTGSSLSLVELMGVYYTRGFTNPAPGPCCRARLRGAQLGLLCWAVTRVIRCNQSPSLRQGS